MLLAELNLIFQTLKFQTTGEKPKVIKKNLKAINLTEQFDKKAFLYQILNLKLICLLVEKLLVGDEASSHNFSN
jgi:hypothetical protein